MEPISDVEITRLISNGDWEAILAMLEDGRLDAKRKVAGNLAGDYHFSLLSTAVEGKANTVIKKLLEHGANPNERSGLSTLLMDACNSQNHEAIDLLLDAGAQIDLKASTGEGGGGETALMFAAEECDVWAVERLLQAGADPTILTPKKRQSAIWFATSTDRREKFAERSKIINTLLSAGCKFIGNEIHWPVQRRDADLVRLLLELGCPVNETFPHNEFQGPSKGDTPLILSVETSVVDMAASFSDQESVPKAKKEIIAGLLSAKADPNVPSRKGQTALLLAVAGNDLETARLLLAAGADPNLSFPNCKAGSALEFARKRKADAFIAAFE